MDPYEALKNARKAVAKLRDCEESREASEAADELADAFEALDGWLSKGGFLPGPWAVGREQAAARKALGG